MAKIKVILLIENSRKTGRGLLRGITRYSRTKAPGYTFIKPLPFYRESTRKIEMLAQLKNSPDIGGIIMRDTGYTYEKIASLQLPTIVFPDHNDQFHDLPVIISDSAEIGKIGADHLLALGFHKLAFCGYDKMPWSWKRSESFSKTVTDADCETHFYKQPKSRARLLWNQEEPIIADWLRSLPKPIGLMACNDDRAAEVVETCETIGLHVPEDIAVIGVDNDDMVCELASPPLSSISLNVERAGYEAAKLLDQLIAGEKMQGQKIPIHATHIVSRQSTDILAIDDPQIARALRYIKQNSQRLIVVDEVVDATFLSRRVLESRFRKKLNRSILSEIRRVRTNMIVLKLLETKMTVSQIAIDMGFSDDKNIARFFRKQKGISPIAYRKKFATEPSV